MVNVTAWNIRTGKSVDYYAPTLFESAQHIAKTGQPPVWTCQPTNYHPIWIRRVSENPPDPDDNYRMED